MNEDKTALNDTDAILDTDHRAPLRKKKKKRLPIIILLGLIFLGLLIVIIKFDVAGIGSRYIQPKLKNVPVIKYIMPKANTEDVYANYTKEQLINVINGSELELDEVNQKIEEQTASIAALEQQIENLKVFEQEHTKFKEEKREFDAQVANMNEESFKKFYEAMYPDNASEIYSDIVKTQQMSKEQKQYASMVAQMDEDQAARVLENLSETDMDIVISILSNMDMESSAAILGQMDHKIAATVIKQLSP